MPGLGLHLICILLSIRWINSLADCGPPNYSVSADLTCTEIDVGAVTPPSDNLEGAKVTYPCKSLLIRTAAKIDYCPVELCETSGVWRDATVSCGTTECFNATSPQNYTGRRICSTSGIMCQRWDSQIPHSHPFTDTDFPGEGLSSAGSYCRDPGGTKGQPWCYLTDPTAVPEWEFCGIPDCSVMDVGQGTCPNNYCGDFSSMLGTDNLCAQVSPLESGYSRYLGSAVTYKCAALLSGFMSTINYCPTRRCHTDFYWTHVTISCAENECYTTGQSGQYSGRRSCTEHGFMCQAWSDQSPHTHSYSDLALFPDTTESSRGSHCRDPGGTKGQPWCYTTDPAVTWGYCDIPLCSDLNVTVDNCQPTTTTASATTSTSSVTTATVTMTTVPTTTEPSAAPSLDGNGTLYERLTSYRAGFDLLSTISDVINAVSCCRKCSHIVPCVMVTYHQNTGTCTLYKENTSNAAAIDCVGLKCYLLKNLV